MTKFIVGVVAFLCGYVLADFVFNPEWYLCLFGAKV